MQDQRWTLVGQGEGNTPLVGGGGELAYDETIELMPVEEHAEVVEDLTESRARAIGHATALSEALRGVLAANQFIPSDAPAVTQARGVLAEYDAALQAPPAQPGPGLFEQTTGPSPLVAALVSTIAPDPEELARQEENPVVGWPPFAIHINGESQRDDLFDVDTEDVLLAEEDDRLGLWIVEKRLGGERRSLPLHPGDVVDVYRYGHLFYKVVSEGAPYVRLVDEDEAEAERLAEQCLERWEAGEQLSTLDLRSACHAAQRAGDHVSVRTIEGELAVREAKGQTG